jgi:hypothetical protein
MTLLLVPHEVGTDQVEIWVGAIDEPGLDAARLAVATIGGPVPTTVGQWDKVIAAGERSIAYRRVPIGGLATHTRFRFELLRDGVVVPGASATAWTLPDHLPTLEERPFTVLLGSCFARAADGAGNVGRAYSLLPADARPDVKILCGDQVYLDSPWMEFVFRSHDEENLRRRHLGNYAQAWTQAGGFRELLRDGGTYFSSDDHDFWNNAPNATAIARDTWSENGRNAWKKVATELYEAFQRAARPGSIFGVDRLSFFVADTRIARTDGKTAFADPAELTRIEAWARNLTGPGCLVLGQLLFSAESGFKGDLMDYGLPDYGQYPQLVEALIGAPHSIVILTGDVHYGRVAVCHVEPGRDIVEIVASPLSLVSRFPSNTWHAAPPEFPSKAFLGVVRRPVQTAEAFRLNANQFTTIAFSQSGAFVRMLIQAWPVETKGRAPAPSHTFEYSVR